MKFVDEVKIIVQAGNGGQGCVSFRREKYVPRGGPDGGDGGKGADVVLEASPGKTTLLDFRYRHRYAAPSGAHGRGANQHGRCGEDLILKVPVGTVVRSVESGEVLADLTRPGQRWVAARGGLGGKGNSRFATSTRQVPRFAQPGEEGERRELLLELKLLADVGLVGLPNAGKSTLIAAISAARPKIADYPFTTVVPNLGVVQYADSAPFVVADIPGLIEGAHLGAGLGHRFLRHIERTRILVHVIDASQLTVQDPLERFHQVERELSNFSSELSEKSRVIVLNKTDLVADTTLLAHLVEAHKAGGCPVVTISALQQRGIEMLLQILTRLLSRETGESASAMTEAPAGAGD